MLTPHQFVTDQAGNKTAVLIDLDTWQEIVTALISLAGPDTVESFEDAALNRAMDEAQNSPTLDQAAALAFLAKIT